jgi:hypothetical protein
MWSEIAGRDVPFGPGIGRELIQCVVRAPLPRVLSRPEYPSSSSARASWANQASGVQSTISRGAQNYATGVESAVGGGYWNLAGGAGSAVGGGDFNSATGAYSTVLGGLQNIASGDYSIAMGGKCAQAFGRASFAAGWNLAAPDHSFIWVGQLLPLVTNSAGQQVSGTVDEPVALPVEPYSQYESANWTEYFGSSTLCPPHANQTGEPPYDRRLYNEFAGRCILGFYPALSAHK